MRGAPRLLGSQGRAAWEALEARRARWCTRWRLRGIRILWSRLSAASARSSGTLLVSAKVGMGDPGFRMGFAATCDMQVLRVHGRHRHESAQRSEQKVGRATRGDMRHALLASCIVMIEHCGARPAGASIGHTPRRRTSGRSARLASASRGRSFPRWRASIGSCPPSSKQAPPIDRLVSVSTRLGLGAEAALVCMCMCMYVNGWG